MLMFVRVVTVFVEMEMIWHLSLPGRRRNFPAPVRSSVEADARLRCSTLTGGRGSTDKQALRALNTASSFGQTMSFIDGEQLSPDASDGDSLRLYNDSV